MSRCLPVGASQTILLRQHLFQRQLRDPNQKFNQSPFAKT
jgi:hypothetical protein